MWCQTQSSQFGKSLATNDLPKSSPPSFATPPPPAFKSEILSHKSEIPSVPRAPSSPFPPNRLINCQRPAPDSRRPGVAAHLRARGRRPNTSQLYTMGWHGQALSSHFLEDFLPSREPSATDCLVRPRLYSRRREMMGRDLIKRQRVARVRENHQAP
jgi:hypothetical protein